MSGPVPEQRLRGVDWRFLLGAVERPRILDLTHGRTAGDLTAAGEIVGAEEDPDLAVLGFPRRGVLRQATSALAPGGEILSTWRVPRPWGVRRARRHLQRSGFADVRFYRPGPEPGSAPARWAPLQPAVGGPTDPPPTSPLAALRRRLWQLLGPVFAIATRGDEAPVADPLRAALPGASAWVLLTGGSDTAAKAVGLPLTSSGERLPVVVKLGRNEASEQGLRREAELLEKLVAERPGLAGVPRLRARGRRAGQLAIAQDAAGGEPLNTVLDAPALAATAPAVTTWLLELAGDPSPAPAESWAPRLIEEPLTAVASGCGERLGPDFAARAKAALAGLGKLPLVWEHRDFGPWNVLAEADGSLCVIDWEDAEPRGLPALDLFYFLVSAMVSPGDAAGDELARYRRAQREMAGPSTEPGRAAAACLESYCRAIGVNGEDFRRLRLLCWLTQARIGLRHLRPGEAPNGDAELFAVLALDELESLEKQR